MTNEEQAEMEWLRWFYQHADFGPADGDVRDSLRAEYVEKTGNPLPEGYQTEADTPPRVELRQQSASRLELILEAARTTEDANDFVSWVLSTVGDWHKEGSNGNSSR